MVDIETTQNVFLSLAIISLAIYVILLVVGSKPTWFLTKRYLTCRDYEDRYAKMLASRKQLLSHYYWAKSNQETKNMKDIENSIVRMDGELREMRQIYAKIKKGEPIPLKIM